MYLSGSAQGREQYFGGFIKIMFKIGLLSDAEESISLKLCVMLDTNRHE